MTTSFFKFSTTTEATAPTVAKLCGAMLRVRDHHYQSSISG